MVREKWKGLAIQAGNSDDGAEASAGLDIESNDLIPSDTVEVTVRTKAYAAGPAELGQSVRKEDADKTPVREVVFPNSRDGVRRIERSLAADQNVFVWCYREIKRTEFRDP
jgi:hypothetical protein